jgi:hypothetical protein
MLFSKDRRVVGAERPFVPESEVEINIQFLCFSQGFLDSRMNKCFALEWNTASKIERLSYWVFVPETSQSSMLEIESWQLEVISYTAILLAVIIKIVEISTQISFWTRAGVGSWIVVVFYTNII